MSLALKLTAIIFLLFVIFFVIHLVKKDKIAIKYSLVWIMPSFILLIFTLIPGLLSIVTKLLGFETASNMVFALLMALLLIITICLTVIVSKQKDQIRLLIQEVSILKGEKNDK